jgi:hypothetical protein
MRSIIFTTLMMAASSIAFAGSLSDMASRFSSSFHKGSGGISNMMIEGTIEAVTPEADEGTRRIQRAAVKYMLDPSSSRSQKHYQDMHSAIIDSVKNPGSNRQSSGRYSSSRSSSSKSRSYRSRSNPLETIQILKVKDGPAKSSCESNWSGKYETSAFTSHRHHSGFLAPTIIEVEIKKVEKKYLLFGDEYVANISVSGLQLFDEYSDIKVRVDENLLVFYTEDYLYTNSAKRLNKEAECTVKDTLRKGLSKRKNGGFCYQPKAKPKETLFAVLMNCKKQEGVFQWGALSQYARWGQ